MIISIDGPAGSGKSTIADILSEKLNFVHFNSGSLYRGITAFMLANNLDFSTCKRLPKIDLRTEFIDDVQHVFVNGVDYTQQLRNNEVSVAAPKISINPKTRQLVDKCQKQFAKSHNVVIDGRDIGSFVFPNADFKFYLDCDIKERAKRRFKEEKEKNSKITLKEIEQQIALRDKIDKEKKIAPLVVPKNAIIIDSTNMTIMQVADKMLCCIQKR